MTYVGGSRGGSAVDPDLNFSLLDLDLLFWIMDPAYYLSNMKRYFQKDFIIL